MCLKVSPLGPLALSPSQVCLLFVPHLNEFHHPCQTQLSRPIAWLLTLSYNLLKSITNKLLLIVLPVPLKSAHFFLSMFLLPHLGSHLYLLTPHCGSLIFFLFCAWDADVPISGQCTIMGLSDQSNPFSISFVAGIVICSVLTNEP